MIFSAFAVICIFLALIAFYFAGRLLANVAWIFGFIKGVAGLTLLLGAGLCVFTALDILSYKELFAEKPILTISFTKEEEQSFETTVSFIEAGNEQKFSIHGDQWQVDARVIRWKGLFKTFGAKPGYRLDRISGRYYSLEDERRKTRSVHQLDQSEYGFDLWQWVQQGSGIFPFFDAVYGSAAYLPMQDGAIYQISLGSNGLVATPVNAIAKEAVNQWL